MPDRKSEIRKENLFIDTLHAVSEIVQTSEKPLTKAEIAEYFGNMELSEEQLGIVEQYLQNTQESKPEIEIFDGKHPDVKTVQKDADMKDSVFFQMYLEDLKKIRPCTQQEEEKLYERLVMGDEAAVQLLSEQWMLRTLELAKKNVAYTEHLADIIQEGNMAVFLALRSMLGSGRKTDLKKQLEEAAWTAMEEYTAEAAAAESLDHSLLAKSVLVYEAQKFLAEELQRIPTVKELSQYTKLQESELEDILSMIKRRNEL